MEIQLVAFESSLVIIQGEHKITLTPFKTLEEGNIKLGIAAPRGVGVDREEIYRQKQEKLKQTSS